MKKTILILSLFLFLPLIGQSAQAEDWSIRVATLNIWDLPFVAKDRKLRTKALGPIISNMNLDFIGFQESWTAKGRKRILKVIDPMDYKKFKASWTIGTGLVSVVPNGEITKDKFFEYSLSGVVGRIWEGDAWAGKGTGFIETEIKGEKLNIFNTHLVAGVKKLGKGDKGGDKKFHREIQRMAQMFEGFDKLLKWRTSDYFFLVGDYNTRLGKDSYEFWRNLTGLEGTYLQEERGDCTSCPRNTYKKDDHKGSQIDYIFVSPGLQVLDANVAFDQTIDDKGKPRSLSDHFGVVARLGKRPSGDSSKVVPMAQILNTQGALIQLREHLKSYIWDLKNDSGNNGVGPDSIFDRICLTCRASDVLKKVDRYLAALHLIENGQESSDKKNEKVRKRLSSYLALF